MIVKTVLVLGGRGFIGRHTCLALQRRGFKVMVGTRRKVSVADSDWLRQVRVHQISDVDQWQPVLAGVDLVVNCVGILRERPGESYLDVHRNAPLMLLKACQRFQVTHLIHISALALTRDARSGFITSKWLGEEALRRDCQTHPLTACTVVRPSLLEGSDGFGSRWLRRMARSPILALPRCLTGRLAVLDVDDLGAAIAALAAGPATGFIEAELGGNERRTMAQHIAALRAQLGLRPARLIAVPDGLGQVVAWACDVLHFSPLSRGHLELMSKDNLPSGRRLEELLGRTPRPIGRDNLEPARLPARSSA